MSWQWPAGAVCGFLVALVTTPAGVSGAVLLLSVDVSLLRVPIAAASSTNLLFNVVAVPGALVRFRQERRLTGPLSGVLLAGTLPGVVAGAVLRVELLSGARTFMIVAAGVLLPLGLWLLLGATRVPKRRAQVSRRGKLLTASLALLVGVLGGIYGIGGGSLLAPVLLAAGFSAYEVAPATLLATFLTSIVGVVTFAVLAVVSRSGVAPDWVLGLCVGSGGLVGSYCGARLQRRIPEASLRKLLGLVACLIAARYTQVAIRDSPGGRPAIVAR